MLVGGHPSPATSRYQNSMISRAEKIGAACISLCDRVTQGKFDVAAEQQLLVDADRIILSFPFYWYSYPAIMKQWMEDVFLPGFAYAAGGDKLVGKEFIVFTTIGAPEHAYHAAGFNNYTLDELLRPIEQSIRYVGGVYLPPFAIYRSLFIPQNELDKQCDKAMEHLARSFRTKRQLYADMIREAEQLYVPLAMQAHDSTPGTTLASKP
nr:NAD(P)H-dependent oxidoreductase [Acetobacter sp. P5B1]